MTDTAPGSSVDTPMDPEADQAMRVELTRMEQAETYDPETIATGPQGPYVPPAVSARREAPTPVEDEARRAVRTPREPKMLEDLYALYPEIGNGVYHLRIERKAPKIYMGDTVSGWLTDLHEQITLEQFANHFGGSRYLVSVVGPARVTAKYDAGQPPKTTTLAEIQLEIHGPPAYGTYPREEQDGFMMRGSQQAFRAGPAPVGFVPINPEIELKKLEIEAEEKARSEARHTESEARERAAQERFYASQTAQPAPGVVEVVQRQAERAVVELKEQSGQLANLLREQNLSLIRANDKLNEELKVLREEIIRVRTDAAEQIRSGETKTVTELKDRHAKDLHEQIERRTSEVTELKDRSSRDLAETKARHNEEVTRVRSEYETKLNEASRNYLERITDAQLRSDKEIAAVRTDAKERVEQMKADFDRTETNLRRDYETRVNDLERNTKREIETIREQRDRELAAATSLHQNENKFTERTANVQLHTLQTENTRLEQKLDASEKEARALRDKMNKDVQTSITEAHELAAMTGMVRKDDIETTGDEAFDWKKQGMKLLSALAEKSPELLQKLGELRGQNSVRAAGVPGQQPPPPMVAPFQPRSLPPMVRGQTPPAGRRVAPPPGMVNGLPPPGMMVGPPAFVGPPVPMTGGPRAGGAVVMASALPPPGPAAPPAQGLQALPNDPSSPIRAVPVEPQAPTGWAPPAPAAPVVAVADGQEQQAIAEFVDALTRAIQEKTLTPTAFANLFIGRAGAPLVQHLLATISPDQIIQAVASVPGGATTQIVTREGQKYVHAVWAEASRALGMAAA